jgi:hypothetical protein
MSLDNSQLQQAPSKSVVLASSAVAVSCPADTNDNVLATVTIPAGAMGPNGRLRITSLWTVTNSANTKGLRVKLGGAGGTDYSGVTLTASATLRTQIEICNRGAPNSQIGFTASQGGFSVSTGANITSAIDTSVAQTIVFGGQKQSAGETITLESYLVELFPG